QLKVPVVCYVIGEGASGGAIGIGVGDKVFMLENTWYSVISPESCSSILWRSWDYKEKAAEQLHLTPTDMYGFGIVDGIIKEPLGGAHNNPEKMAGLLRQHILSTLQELSALDTETLLEQRLDKFASIGDFVVQ
ncbi:MAG: acetyl-CoA carboxylase carboxyl transferase subunit alpha, partial [Chitinophagales bacterium]